MQKELCKPSGSGEVMNVKMPKKKYSATLVAVIMGSASDWDSIRFFPPRKCRAVCQSVRSQSVWPGRRTPRSLRPASSDFPTTTFERLSSRFGKNRLNRCSLRGSRSEDANHRAVGLREGGHV